MGALLPAYQTRETRESNTGSKLLSAYRRAIVPVSVPSFPVGAGLAALAIGVPPALLPAPSASPGNFPMQNNLRWKIKGSAVLYPAHQGDLSLESASLVAQMGTAGNPLFGQQIAQPARFGSLTALAAFQGVAWDDWIIDCNDYMQFTVPPGVPFNPGPYNMFNLQVYLVVNNTGAAQTLAAFVTLEITAGQFDSYRFDKWE